MHEIPKGGRWVRATHTEMLDEWPGHSRPPHLEMPLLTESMRDLMDYPAQGDMAFCFPLSFADNSEGGPVGAHARYEGYCKAALFLARQMLTYWDMRECGVPIYFGVAENGLDIFRAYAAHCDFPDRNLIVLPSYAGSEDAWNIKFDLLDQPFLDMFDRRVHFDVSWWIRLTEPMPRMSELLSVWTDQHALVKHGSLMCGDPATQWWVDAVPESVWDGFTRLFGGAPNDHYEYWQRSGVEHVSGCYFGFTRESWAAERDLIFELCKVTHIDEAVLAPLARHHNWIDKDILYATEGYFQKDMHRFFKAWMWHMQPEQRYMQPGTSFARTVDQFSTWRAELGYSVDEETPATAYPSAVLPMQEASDESVSA